MPAHAGIQALKELDATSLAFPTDRKRSGKTGVWHDNCAYAIIAALFLTLLLALPAHAAIQEIRVVGVGKDSSPEAANKKALDYARKRAVYLVLQKMRIEEADKKAAALKENQLNRIIRGANVTQTKQMEGVVYADVTVSILDTVLLQEIGIEKPETISRSTPIRTRGVLVLPIYVVRDRPYVWEKENLLRAPLRSEVLHTSHGSVVVPTGDFEDLRLIDFRNALTAKSDELKPMFDRYGVEEIIIAVVTREPPDSEGESTILLRRLNAKEIRNELITLPPPGEDASPDDRLMQAVAAIANAATEIALSTSKQQREILDKSTHIPITFYYAGVRELGKMQKEIRATEGVLHLSMPAISIGDMKGVLYISGEPEAVRDALVKQGMVVKDENHGWKVSLR